LAFSANPRNGNLNFIGNWFAGLKQTMLIKDSFPTSPRWRLPPTPDINSPSSTDSPQSQLLANAKSTKHKIQNVVVVDRSHDLAQPVQRLTNFGRHDLLPNFRLSRRQGFGDRTGCQF
jgi:hypothetical protein